MVHSHDFRAHFNSQFVTDIDQPTITPCAYVCLVSLHAVLFNMGHGKGSFIKVMDCFLFLPADLVIVKFLCFVGYITSVESICTFLV